jgi:hypothetical protein
MKRWEQGERDKGRGKLCSSYTALNCFLETAELHRT